MGRGAIAMEGWSCRVGAGVSTSELERGERGGCECGVCECDCESGRDCGGCGCECRVCNCESCRGLSEPVPPPASGAATAAPLHLFLLLNPLTIPVFACFRHLSHILSFLCEGNFDTATAVVVAPAPEPVLVAANGDDSDDDKCRCCCSCAALAEGATHSGLLESHLQTFPSHAHSSSSSYSSVSSCSSFSPFSLILFCVFFHCNKRLPRPNTHPITPVTRTANIMLTTIMTGVS